MKFLEYTPLDRINDFLSELNLGERTIKGRLEAYSCKHTGTDKKLSLSLENEILDYLGKSSDTDSSPVEFLLSRSRFRKTLIYLVLTLYHMYPDYDFSAVKAHQFLTEESWDTFKQIFDTNMLEASKLLLLHSPISCSCGIFAGHEYNLSDFSLEFAWSSVFLGVNQTHETLGQWCVVFMSFGVKEMDLGEDADADAEWIEAYGGSSLLETIYKALDEVVKLSECEIYSYNPDSDADPFLEKGAINLVADGFAADNLCYEEDGEIFDNMDI
ncbi:repressor of RNA polymerase III transcription MAF1-like protein [Gossypium australe]|uniref:Repressor of RNA polymerase III transcription n=1 Tax=Gossypium australe TaxID=47621 RepID=A0A5B6UX44_9ROSI|nr:repressor of RNA polymerase III transcription MAF1-like protein [Gossypium australe]